MISEGEIEIWNAAAAREEISKSEFLRRALRERSQKILAEQENTAQTLRV